MTTFFDMQLSLQVALGGGYLAYVIAYAGLRRDHGANDAVFITLAFGVLGALSMAVLLPRVGPVWAAAVSLLASILAGAFWRWRARSWAYALLRRAGIHGDDGIADGWTALIQERGLAVTQVAVYLKDGRELFCSQLGPYTTGPKRGLELGSDGSVTMVVEEEEAEGQREPRTHIIDPVYGTRLTHVPADQIARIELRVL